MVVMNGLIFVGEDKDGTMEGGVLSISPLEWELIVYNRGPLFDLNRG